MILNIKKSDIFKVSPDIRFAKEYSVPVGSWNKIWSKYKFYGYNHGDIKDYVFIKHARNLGYTTIDRWIMRAEIYNITEPLLKKGVECVSSEIFNEWEQPLMDYLFKTIKSGASTKSRIII